MLALVPGLIALLLYYRGLRNTPASRATSRSSLFRSRRPSSASRCWAALAPTQWLGFAIVLVAVVGLALHERRSERPPWPSPDRADEAIDVRG